ncbi:MAG: DUF4336 domain-containing protein [Proteobacteria bacterium]|nr:DUF4336 domain-containing protein [Pseudomonadota bacterium]
MAKILEEWSVFEHTQILKLTENIWTVEGAVPKMSLRRRMTVIRLETGGLIIHNPIALSSEEMNEIEEWGSITYIIVPNAWHRLDSKIYKHRYPDAEIVCPRGSRRKIEEVLPVDLTYDKFPQPKPVEITHIEGLKKVEGVIEVATENGGVLIFTDLVFNIPHQSGVGGFILRLMGSSGGPKVTRVMKLLAVKDKNGVRSHLLKLAEKHEKIRYIIPGHGDIVEQECKQVLKDIADAI